MKKRLLVILTILAMLVLTLAACGKNTAQTANDPPEEEMVSSVQEQEEESEPEEAALEESAPEESSSEEPAGAVNRTLVTFFSNTGNTKEVAELIAEYTGGDLNEIRRTVPYENLREEAKVDIDDGVRPEITADITDISAYDTIFVGFPIWWDEAPAMIATFLENGDFSGKTIVPFCTSASDTIENSLHIFGELCPDAVIADGLTANDTEEIGPWLQQLGYEVSVVSEGTPITITAGGQVFEAVLDDSETAAAFADMLPMTLSMQRVGGDREFYGGMDSALPYDSTDVQTAFENGDIAFWLGGDGLCLLYNNQVENPEISAGIIVFGKITSDLSGFFDMDDHLDVVIEIEQ